MRYLLLLLFPVLVQCHKASQADEKKAAARPPVHLKKSARQLADELAMDTAKPAIQRAWYEFDTEAKAPTGISSGSFSILADTSFKAAGFVSIEERFLRYFSTVADTTISYYRAEWVRPWKKLTKQQRRNRIAREQAAYARKADSLHKLNNQGSYRVWLLNNSADTIALATQDASLICVLQAQNACRQWQAVEFWRSSGCGNSNIAKYLLPQEPISFLAKSPRHGNFKTTLRYKLAGAKRFYYSNEFEGYVNYGNFKEAAPFYLDADGIKRESRPLYKLDKLFPADYRGNVASSFLRGGKTIKLLPH
jgi:hypothetical protein